MLHAYTFKEEEREFPIQFIGLRISYVCYIVTGRVTEGHHDFSICRLCFFPLSCCFSLAFLAMLEILTRFCFSHQLSKTVFMHIHSEKTQRFAYRGFSPAFAQGVSLYLPERGGKPCKCSCEGACIRVCRGFFASPNLLWCFCHRMSRKWSLANMFDRGFLPVTYLLILTTSQTTAYDCSYTLVPSFCWSSSSLQKPGSENVIRPFL